MKRNLEVKLRRQIRHPVRIFHQKEAAHTGGIGFQADFRANASRITRCQDNRGIAALM
jgi:hypothetical protein